MSPARKHDPNSPFHHPCNLPIPESLYEEFINDSWRGFRFLQSQFYDNAVDENGHPVGDLLRTLVFGPDYGHYVLHQSSGLVLGMRSGSMQLFQLSTDGFVLLDETRTRGRSALSFAAHPLDTVIAYGDNYGNFHAHRFSEQGFGKATKVVAKVRKASAVEYIDEGQVLIIGGMGYVATFQYADKKFDLIHELGGAVRDLKWVEGQRVLLVNRGLHGLEAHRYDQAGFSRLGEIKREASVQQVAVSKDFRHIAVSGQHSSEIGFYNTSF